MFERLESAQPWAIGEATDNSPSISNFSPSTFTSVPRMKQKASILHLWLIIDPLARLHVQERERLVDEERAGLQAVLPAFPPRSKGCRQGGRFVTEGS